MNPNEEVSVRAVNVLSEHNINVQITNLGRRAATPVIAGTMSPYFSKYCCKKHEMESGKKAKILLNG